MLMVLDRKIWFGLWNDVSFHSKIQTKISTRAYIDIHTCKVQKGLSQREAGKRAQNSKF